MKVLVAYASEHGSTAEMGQAIAKVLEDRGITVTTAAVQTITSIEGYDTFVFGSAVHAGTWLPAMSGFLRKFQKQLAGKPVYLWVSCIRIMEQFGYEHVMEYYMIPEILVHLNVRDKTAFAGKLDLNQVDWNERWTLAARYDGSSWPANFDGDFRDWDKINAWANKIADEVLALKAAKSAL